MSIKKIRALLRKENKRISKDAVKKIMALLENATERIIKTAVKNADFAGRATIKAEDIEEL